MSCSAETAISVEGVGKYFEIYEKPSHRLWQMLWRGRRTFYRPFWALTDVSFSVARGECVGIIGRNGAGKSTLLQIIAGTLTPSRGAVRTAGRVAALLELGSGFNPEFTGRENVYLNASILGLRKEEIDARYDAIAAFADIGRFLDQPVKSYSSGMTVRLAFAVVAHVDADVLIVDEALAVGDAFFTQKCMRFLRRFMETNTVLFVSHDVAAVNSLCNRAVLLEQGRVKRAGSPKEITRLYLEGLYASMQGENGLPASPCAPPPAEEDFYDMRREWINSGPLRNDIKIFRFEERGEAFGKGGAVIENVTLTDARGRPLQWLVGGETAALRVRVAARRDLFSPIVGFYCTDRLGQRLFGDNTWLACRNAPLGVAAGERFTAEFVFRMPILPAGEYSISVAVAEGTQAEHVQHEWRHDALLLTSVSTSEATGLLGIPMRRIELRKIIS